MQVPFILLPFFVQVALTFAFLLGLGVFRGEAAASEGASQAELLLLFFALAPLAILTRKADLVFVVLAWVFVILQLVRAGVRMGSNDARTQSWPFVAAAVVLLIMWVKFALQILFGF
jgi:hypothetical protein